MAVQQPGNADVHVPSARILLHLFPARHCSFSKHAHQPQPVHAASISDAINKHTRSNNIVFVLSAQHRSCGQFQSRTLVNDPQFPATIARMLFCIHRFAPHVYIYTSIIINMHLVVVWPLWHLITCNLAFPLGVFVSFWLLTPFIPKMSRIFSSSRHSEWNILLCCLLSNCDVSWRRFFSRFSRFKFTNYHFQRNRVNALIIIII